MKINLFALTGFGNEALTALLQNKNIEITKLYTRKEPSIFPYYDEQQIDVVAKKNNINCVYIPNNEDWLVEDEVDINLVVTFHRLFTNNHLKYAKQNINIHPSILPKYKGSNPFKEMLRNKEKSFGLSAHHMTSIVDSGEIIYQKNFIAELTSEAKIRKYLAGKTSDFINILIKEIQMNQVDTKHTQKDYALRDEAVEFPMMSVLSFSYVCNALCPNCPYTNSDIRNDYKDAKYMSAEIFKKIADEVGEHNAWLRISGGGEPTMHPEFLELMIYAKEKGCKLGIITNGSLMDKNLAKSLLEIDVDMLEFSVDASNQNDYDIVRKGLNFNELVQNLKTVYQLRNTMNSKTKIIASAINQNNINVDEVEKFWLPYVDNFQKRKYLTWGINDASNSADDTPYLPPEKRVPCPFLFERLNIDSRGQIMMCGYDIAANTNMGNINDDSIKEIWHGKEFNFYRDKHLQKKGDDINLCKNCPDWKYRSWKHNYWKLVDNAEIKRDDTLNLNDSEGSVEVE